MATAVLTIGLVAIASGFQYAAAAISTGGGETAAVFLAEQRIEHLRAEAAVDFSAPILGAGRTTEYCLAGHTASSAPNCQGTPAAGLSYIRSTTISDVTSGTGCPTSPLACKQVEVRVGYRPVTSAGHLDQQRTVDIVTVLGPRA